MFVGFAPDNADHMTIYVASRPATAPGGGFVGENLEDVDTLTPEEIDAGLWVEDLPQDPGKHYLMLNAHTETCPFEECDEGFSNVLAVTLPAKTLTGADARDDVEGAMSNGNMSVEWLAGYAQRITGCRRLSRLRVRCHVSWFVGDATFTGWATAVRHLGVDDRVHWSIRDVNDYCRATGGRNCTSRRRGSYRP